MIDIQPRPTGASSRSSLADERPVGIPHGDGFLTGSLAAPRGPRAMVLIANDRGHARHAPALRLLASELRGVGFATLMVDLLTISDDESPDVAARLRMETELLAGRIVSARLWLSRSALRDLPLVLLGLGGAAPAALLVAACRPAKVAAVIACGPHPDAAGLALRRVSVPVLLIAHRGRFDETGAHARALGWLGVARGMAVLEGATDPAKDAVDVARASEAFLGLADRAQNRQAAA